MPSPHPAWYKRYPFGFSVIRLTAIILQHAEDITVVAQQVHDMEEAERQREVLRFEEMLESNNSADNSMAQDEDSVAFDATFSDKLKWNGTGIPYAMPLAKTTDCHTITHHGSRITRQTHRH